MVLLYVLGADVAKSFCYTRINYIDNLFKKKYLFNSMLGVAFVHEIVVMHIHISVVRC